MVNPSAPRFQRPVLTLQQVKLVGYIPETVAPDFMGGLMYYLVQHKLPGSKPTENGTKKRKTCGGRTHPENRKYPEKCGNEKKRKENNFVAVDRIRKTSEEVGKVRKIRPPQTCSASCSSHFRIFPDTSRFFRLVPDVSDRHKIVPPPVPLISGFFRIFPDSSNVTLPTFSGCVRPPQN